MIWNLRSAGQSSVGREVSSRSLFHDHAPAICGSRRTPVSDGFFRSSNRAAGSLNLITSGGYCSSLSSLVTGIDWTDAETKCGFGRFWYHFHDQSEPQAINNIPSTSNAFVHGRLLPKRDHASLLRASQVGGFHEIRPKRANQTFETSRPSQKIGRKTIAASLAREAGIFMV